MYLPAVHYSCKFVDIFSKYIYIYVYNNNTCYVFQHNRLLKYTGFIIVEIVIDFMYRYINLLALHHRPLVISKCSKSSCTISELFKTLQQLFTVIYYYYYTMYIICCT